MIPIKQLINKMKWDERENPKEYTFMFRDFSRLIPINGTQVDNAEIEGNSLVFEKTQGDTITELVIPMHRIKKVFIGTSLIWERIY